ncbi:MAG: hypothetical protein WB783_03835 [Arenicellales bacterium]
MDAERGVGEPIRAIIWMSDLRGYSSLTDRLPGRDLRVVVNEYFERLAGAVIGKDGRQGDSYLFHGVKRREKEVLVEARSLS